MSKLHLSRSTLIGFGSGIFILVVAYLINHSGCFDCGWIGIDYCEYKEGVCPFLRFPGYLTLTPYYFILFGPYEFYEKIGLGGKLLQEFIAIFTFLAIVGWLGSRIGRWYHYPQRPFVD